MSVLDRLRPLIDVDRLRHRINRRRRLVASILAGLGVLLLVSTLRSPAPASTLGQLPTLALESGEVAVPVLIQPAGAVNSLVPGMIVDLVQPGSRTVTVSGARVLELPSTGFGPTSESIAIVALPEEDAITVASQPSAPMGVMIHTRE